MYAPRRKDGREKNRIKSRLSQRLVGVTLLFVGLASCTNPEATSNRSAAKAESVISDLITGVDENGIPTQVAGFTQNDGLNQGGRIDAQTITSKEEANQKIFEFKPPAGYESEFSEPVLTTGSFLALTAPNFQDCESKAYGSSEPTLEDMFRFGRGQDLCGDITLNFCIKLTATGANSKASYLKTPLIKLRLPCAIDSFTGASFSMNQTAAGAASSVVDLRITANPIVTDMYLTNSPSCSTGGSWEPRASEKKSWVLSQEASPPTVYLVLRDIMGHESSCFNASLDITPPSGTSLTIDAGRSHTQASAVTLSLAATDAASMYITNTAGCESGGAWQAFATSQNWMLAQSNNLATVYVQFKDAVGNKSACLNSSILHDNIAPTGAALSVSSGAAVSSSSLVSLSLVASGASEMYITNTTTCSGGGAWEAFATTKATWSLSQSNSIASVAVKFRDQALNETPCVVDTILHDGIAPSTPGSWYDGVSTSSVTSTPKLAWTSASDTGSGVASYEVALGTTPGSTDAKAWTNVGDVSSATLSGLALSPGVTYYASVRALDQAGNPSAAALGDGFVAGSTSWRQQAYVKASNSDANDAFGKMPAIYGDTLAVSARGEDSAQTTISYGASASADNSAADAGAVYVYTRSATSWAQSAYLKAGNAEAGDNFGTAIALYDDRLAVSAYGEGDGATTITNSSAVSADNSKPSSGVVYMYKRTGTTWQQEAFIKASNSAGSNYFGTSLGLTADTLAVGSSGEDSGQTTVTNGTTSATDTTQNGAGAAYVYKRTATTWAQEAYLKASNMRSLDAYGTAIALSEDTVAVGAWGEDSNQATITNGPGSSNDTSIPSSGAVYVYGRAGTTWAQQAYIKAANRLASGYFGNSLALSSDTLAVSSYTEGSNLTTVTNGTTATADNSNPGSGAAYVYRRTGTTWQQEAYFKASNNDANDAFGFGIAVSGDTLALGADGEDSNQTTITNGTTASADNSHTDSGAVYVYKRAASIWTQEAYIKASNNDASDSFGMYLALDADTLAVSAADESSNQTTITNGTTASADNSSSAAGAIYIYIR